MKKNKSIKLFVVTPYFYPKIGGLEKHTYNLYKGLKQNYNYEIVIVTSNHEDKTYKEENLEGMKIYRLPRQFKISNTPISFKWKSQIKSIIEKEKPSIIMAHSPVPFISDIVVLSNNKIPVIFKYHSGSMKKNKFLLDLLIILYEKIILNKVLKKVDKLICTSDFVRLNFLKEYLTKSVTITPAVDINLFKPSNKITKNTILYIGRLDKTSRWKGVNYLLEGIKIVKRKIPKVSLNVIGEGDDIEFYSNMAKKLNISKSFNFIGEKTGIELSNQYAKGNVLVLPSVSEAEAFGMVLIEAMACKKPVIGSNIGGIPYVIDNGKNGLLVPPKDPKALAEAIIKILENPNLAKQMGENGYKKVRKYFTWDKQVKKTKKVIEEVLRKK